MVILDSNVWIAFFCLDDSQHAKALVVFAKTPKPILLPEYIVLEVTNVLATRVNQTVAQGFLLAIQDNQDVQLLLSQPDFFESAVTEFLSKPYPKLSFVDVALVALAQEYPVVTFDRALHQALHRTK